MEDEVQRLIDSLPPLPADWVCQPSNLTMFSPELVSIVCSSEAEAAESNNEQNECQERLEVDPSFNQSTSASR